MYSFGARLAGAECRSVPRDEQFEIDLPASLDAVDSTTKMVLVNSPNNPTGSVATEEDLEQLLGTGALVVVDEAYFEFAGESAAGLLDEHENLVVLRTMSKWAGIAGLRVGYGMMSPALVKYLLDIKQPYNVTTAGEVALLASLADADYLMKNVGLIVNERERMFGLLESTPGIKPWPSRGNYILCNFPAGRARKIFDGLASRGIFLRTFGHERLRDCIRTTVGTPEQTDALIAALKELV
jgi:histidinol-phosphate aminotransferase